MQLWQHTFGYRFWNLTNEFAKSIDMEKKFEWTDAKVADVARKVLAAERSAEKWSDIECPKHIIEQFKSEHSQQYPKGILNFNCGRAGIRPNDTSLNYDQWVRSHLKDNDPIHSVVNSSGETLSVGMETNYGKIKRFGLLTEVQRACDKDVIFADTENGGDRNIDTVHPAKPVFRTEDGYELKDCEFYTVVNKSDFSTNVLRYIKGADNEKQYFEVYYWFQNKSNAEAFVKDNKPQFSRKDILGAAINDYKTPNQLYITVDKSKLGL